MYNNNFNQTNQRTGSRGFSGRGTAATAKPSMNNLGAKPPCAVPFSGFNSWGGPPSPPPPVATAAVEEGGGERRVNTQTAAINPKFGCADPITPSHLTYDTQKTPNLDICYAATASDKSSTGIHAAAKTSKIQNNIPNKETQPCTAAARVTVEHAVLQALQSPTTDTAVSVLRSKYLDRLSIDSLLELQHWQEDADRALLAGMEMLEADVKSQVII